MRTEYRFIEPVDALYLRGNRLFGEAAGHGEALMPPWPSLFAGALRSYFLIEHSVSLNEFSKGIVKDEEVRRVLGTPQEPGSFRISFTSIGKREEGRIKAIFPLPADLIVTSAKGDSEEENVGIEKLVPVSREDLAPLEVSHPLPSVAVFPTERMEKTKKGMWMTEEGLKTYLAGNPVSPVYLVPKEELWACDMRLGIAIDRGRRTAMEGRIYTAEAIAMKEGTGFIVGVRGEEGMLPREGLLRLGGDGRGAQFSSIEASEPWDYLPIGERFKMILATPGIFYEGWIPPCVEKKGEEFIFSFSGLEARLICGVSPRHQIVSGWDIAKGIPKPTDRVVPAGSVYWFEVMSGDMGVLEDLLQGGLWPLEKSIQGENTVSHWAQRKAEGFNNVFFAEW